MFLTASSTKTLKYPSLICDLWPSPDINTSILTQMVIQTLQVLSFQTHLDVS